MSIKIYDNIVLFGRKTFEWDRYNYDGKRGREKATEMLNVLGANTDYTQIDFDAIIDKYRGE